MASESIPAAAAQAQLISKIQSSVSGQSRSEESPAAVAAERERIESLGAMSRDAVKSISDAQKMNLVDIKA